MNTRDGQFQKIIFHVLYSKSADCFGKIIQHYLKTDRIRLCERPYLDELGRNILMYATSSTDHFKKLIELCDGEDLKILLNQKDKNGHNCFVHACLFDNKEVMKILLEKFDNNWVASTTKEGSIFSILATKESIQILEYLFDQRKSNSIVASSKITECGKSFLSQICSTGSEKSLKFFTKRNEADQSLLSQIFPLPKFGQHFIDCISLALTSDTKRSTLVSKRLLTYLKDIIVEEQWCLLENCFRGYNGETILMIATICTDSTQFLLHLAEAQNVLLELLADTDFNGNSILRWACLSGNLDSIKLLMTQFNFQWKIDFDNKGATLLHILCERGHLQVRNSAEISKSSFFKTFF